MKKEWSTMKLILVLGGLGGSKGGELMDVAMNAIYNGLKVLSICRRPILSRESCPWDPPALPISSVPPSIRV